MATFGWGTDRSVEQFLYENAHRYNFFQAVKLLEILHPDRTPVGVEPDPFKETVRFKHRVSLEFPASDVVSLDRTFIDEPDELTVNFLGLAGSNSPLPASYAELILKRLWHKDQSFQEFLNLFNHRLVSLMYRIRKKYHIGFEFKPPYDDFFSTFLYSLSGLGTNGLCERMRVKDRSLLFYTGLLNQQPHSMTGLETILSHYFKFRVKGKQFFGQWYNLEPDQHTRIGRSGQNQILGENALLGKRVWQDQGKFRLTLGPLSVKQYLDILPIGRAFVPLNELTRFYVGHEFDFDFNPVVQAKQVPESRLGGEFGPRLGWTSWLKTRRFDRDDRQVRLHLNSGKFILNERRDI